MQSSMRARGGPEKHGEALLPELRRALQNKDIDTLAQLYADDAVLEEVSGLSPPAHPMLLEGRGAVVERLKNEIFRDPISGWARQLESIEVLDGIETDDGLAFTEVRTYAAGDKVVAQHLARKRGSLIGYERIVVAWDAE